MLNPLVEVGNSTASGHNPVCTQILIQHSPSGPMSGLCALPFAQRALLPLPGLRAASPDLALQVQVEHHFLCEAFPSPREAEGFSLPFLSAPLVYCMNPIGAQIMSCFIHASSPHLVPITDAPSCGC